MTVLTRPADLPDFKRPPISEAVLSMQFASLTKLQNVHMGLLWNRIRSKYPKVTEQAPIAPVFETFGSSAALSEQRLQIEALLSPPVHRYWFEEESGGELLQFQQDRIIHNWRRGSSTGEYPRYETVRAHFGSDLAAVIEFLHDEGLGEIRPNQCELTYVNSIELSDGDPYKQIERVTTLWTGKSNSKLEIENAQLQTRFLLQRDGKPYGRVYVSLSPAIYKPNNAPIMKLEIVARGKPDTDTVEEAFALLDEQRGSVVRMFNDITTPEMHKLWEKVTHER